MGLPGFSKDGESRSSPAEIEALARESVHVRRLILTTIAEAGLGHVGGDLSVTDILVTLFFGVLDIDPADPQKPDRDRFILSKGHCAAALYTVLARRGFFDEAELFTFMKPMSRLNGHPNRRKVPGVEANTGPLGHGLPIALGAALGAQIASASWRAFCVTGDGELQEGSNWEAAMFAGHRKLSNLTVVVDRNGLQQGARTEDTNDMSSLGEKFAAFGWEVRDIDGHDHAALVDALSRRGESKPVAIIARTVKGKGVSFMEHGVEWHHGVPNAAQVEAALKELVV
ncbi:transketolase [Aurantimonas sp. HBX-1]|uniref:transketolase n=1 Tax=Aurantimonas sp. HBX-1 TaxID=2906072 RepID=UPI001F227EE6|nr:transketolase [Aurantimonas sp. HBX-1]UIJ72636.1 transketolase [Aurantimonas sp. HBX-1]